uniref:CBM21 domain-containing protein n=1 Tax=Acrobeloides nanus TaxID=290746 RepID=A0A914CHB9_9BILA
MVCLENALILEEPYQIYGTIAALNIAKETLVYIRYTLDGWKSHIDVIAPLLSSSTVYDIYYFVLNIPKPTTETNRIEFCIYCNINDKRTFCDNNNDANYVIMLEMKPPDLLPFKKVTRKHKKRHHHNQYVVENLDYINEAWKTYDKGC